MKIFLSVIIIPILSAFIKGIVVVVAGVILVMRDGAIKAKELVFESMRNFCYLFKKPS